MRKGPRGGPGALGKEWLDWAGRFRQEGPRTECQQEPRSLGALSTLLFTPMASEVLGCKLGAHGHAA